VLIEVEKNDQDEGMRNEASKWIEALFPVKLLYYGFVAELTDSEECARIDENELNVFDIPTTSIRNPSYFDRKRAQNALQTFFHDKLINLEFRMSASKSRDFMENENMSHELLISEIRVPGKGMVKGYNRISGEVYLSDKQKGEKYNYSYTVDRKNDKLLVLRRGNNLDLLLLHFVSDIVTDIEQAEIDGPVYQNLYNDFYGCTIHSSRSTTSEKDFGRAKVEIPYKKGYYILIGNILFDKKKRMFIARDASLFNARGMIIDRGSQISVPINNPEKYLVVGNVKE
jgi:hypothetical protein